MKDSVKVGMNKTGIQMAPILGPEMLSGVKEFEVPKVLDERITFGDLRGEYARHSSDLGTIPMPGSAKGALNTALQMIKGDHPEVLVDKLGERLAFERSGVRLYEALITKCQAVIPDYDLSPLLQIQNDEALHFLMIRDVMETLGLDPTAQTPCADSAGIASMGLIQVITDPRTTVAQAAEAILIAELTDNDGWDLLIDLTRSAGLDDATEKFESAKANEERHLTTIRAWLKELVMQNKSVPIQ